MPTCPAPIWAITFGVNMKVKAAKKEGKGPASNPLLMRKKVERPARETWKMMRKLKTAFAGRKRKRRLKG
jgi:hypothetical protein